jgi:lipopolysaccharide export system protein LptA
MSAEPTRTPGARSLLRAAALAAALALAGPAAGEKADREKPINLEADRVTIDDAKQVATFEGNVVLTQGTMQIRADRMVVRQDAEGFQYGTAYGNLASFRQKREGFDEWIEGFAERIEYDGKADKLQMFKRALLKRTGDEVRGDYISYDSSTEFFRVLGGGKQAGTTGNPEGRVRAVLQPKPKAEPPPAPPVTLKPESDVAAPREPAPASKR